MRGLHRVVEMQVLCHARQQDRILEAFSPRPYYVVAAIGPACFG
jgi:hypothetical protein